MRIYLTNAFSLSMIDYDKFLVAFDKVNVDQVKEILQSAKITKTEIITAIGHQSTAEFLSKLLDINIPVERKMVKLDKGDYVIVFQLLQRLPEGKVLTEDEIKDYPFQFYISKVINVQNIEKIENVDY